jgi:hypothetical protein
VKTLRWFSHPKKIRSAERFRRFSAEKSAGYGVFPRRMSVEKQIS